MNPPRKDRAFTLTEVLVVIGVIALLAVLGLPSLQKSLSSASKAKCLQRLHEIHVGSTAYAGENNGLYPFVNNGYWGPNYFPVSIYDETLKPYLGDRNKIMFCVGDLYKIRNPQLKSPDYASSYITYQYFNYTGDFSGTLTGPKKPNLSRTATAQGSLPLWGCMASMSGKVAYGHSDPGVARAISGMCVITVNGSAQWVKGADLEAYAYSATTFYWPKPAAP